MKKRLLALVLALGMCVTPAMAEESAYDKAVAELREPSHYSVDATLEADLCSVFLYHRVGAPHSTYYYLDLIYKDGSGLGGGTVVRLPLHTDNPSFGTTFAPDTLELNEDGTCLIYTYHAPDGGESYIVDLATGEVTTREATPGNFIDVPAGSWFEEGVQTCAEKGVMVGTGEGKFSPDTRLNTAECLTLALRLYDLQRGGDGTLEKAPEDWGKLTLTLNDGTVYEGYGEVYEPFGWADGGGLIISCEDHGPTLWDQEVWGTARSGSATVTVDGRTIPGAMHLEMGYSDFFLTFIPDNILDVGVLGNIYEMHAPSPGTWYRDALYTAYQLGLDDETAFPGFAALLEWGMSGLTFRKDFAGALADAAGDLEKKYTVETIYDVYNNETSSLSREENKGLYTLYEAGVLNGINEFGTLGGHEYLTRAQAAVMVARVLDPEQRLTQAPTVPSGYDLAVTEMRAGFGYMNERTIDADECTIFIHDSGGMHSQFDIMTVIYKPGSTLGDGHTIGLPHARVQYLVYAYPADTMTLSEDGKTFTYTYYRPEDIVVLIDGPYKGDVLEKAGQVTYTVDLPTGEITETFSPLNYEGAMAHVKRKRAISSSERSEDRETVDVLENGQCTAVLTKGRVADQYDDYILSLVYKPGSELGDGVIKRLTLPSTIYKSGYKPTDRAPDHMEFSEDGSKFTYSYRFPDRLAYTGYVTESEQAEFVLHEAGTYVYTVDVETGELSVNYTAE